MNSPQVNLKDPLLAAILAFLVPGLGHLYQGRLFKAAIYSVCILSLYIYGLSMSDWKIVQYRGGPDEPRTELLSFIAQAGVGLPGLFAMNQSRRYRRSPHRAMMPLREEFSAPFTGAVELHEAGEEFEGTITGDIHLAPAVGQFEQDMVAGNITGTLSDGRETTLSLAEGVRLGPVLRNEAGRSVEGDVVREEAGGVRIGRVTGEIPRSFWNWFLVPLSALEEQDLHRQLGKYHELALVFTMIAGLLNILAVWDAFDGPAYGYGVDPHPQADEDDEDSPDAASSLAKTVSAGASS